MGLLEQIQEQVINIIGKANPQLSEGIRNFFQQFGGVDGVIKKLQDGGYRETVQSWINTGTNTPITPEQITQVFGNEKIKAIAEKVGVNPKVIAQQLAQYLPIVIDKLTPEGQLPTAGNILNNALNKAKGFFK